MIKPFERLCLSVQKKYSAVPMAGLIRSEKKNSANLMAKVIRGTQQGNLLKSE